MQESVRREHQIVVRFVEEFLRAGQEETLDRHNNSKKRFFNRDMRESVN